MSAHSMVTGEAVVLNLRPAPLVMRAAASLIDVVLLLVALFALTVLVVGPAVERMDPAAAQATLLTSVIAVVVGAPLLWETFSHGRSLGKLALGLQVMRDDGGAIQFRHAVLRALTGFLELWMSVGAVALIVSMLNARGKRLGDMAAGTTVVLVRQGQRRPELPPLPERLSSWSEVADLGRLPDELAVAITRFLRQAPQMTPAHREMTAQRLVAAVGPYVTPGPPPGIHPEEFLVGVIAERRDRDQQILLARRERSERAAERIRSLQL